MAAGGGTPPLLIAGLVAAVGLSAAASLGYLRLRRRLAQATRRDDGILAT